MRDKNAHRKRLLALLLFAPVIAGCSGASDMFSSDLLSKDAEWFSRSGRLFIKNVSIETPPLTPNKPVTADDLVSAEGYAETMRQAGATVGFDAVRVWHCNDAKAERGSKLDRHEHIGQGTMGVEPFRRLLNDERFAHAAFIAETPVDEPGDEERNVRVLLSLVGSA